MPRVTTLLYKKFCKVERFGMEQQPQETDKQQTNGGRKKNSRNLLPLIIPRQPKDGIVVEEGLDPRSIESSLAHDHHKSNTGILPMVLTGSRGMQQKSSLNLSDNDFSTEKARKDVNHQETVDVFPSCVPRIQHGQDEEIAGKEDDNREKLVGDTELQNVEAGLAGHHDNIEGSSRNSTKKSLYEELESFSELKDSQLILLSGPPMTEIHAIQTEDELSDIGEGMVEDDITETKLIGGVEVICNPSDDDICFDDRGHPGTQHLINIIRDLLLKLEGLEYSPPIYKTIKKQLKGRRFLIRTRHQQRTWWSEASKPEVIQLLGDCFNMERQQQEKPVNDDDSEINSTLQDSVIQPSADGLGFGEENQIVTLFNSDDKSTQCLALQQVKDDLFHAINEISKHVNENEKRKGKAAEDKLLMLHSLSTHPSIPTEIIDSLLKLADFKNQIQIASIAPFFGCLERIELSLNDFLSQIQVSSDSQTDNSRQKPNSGADGNGIGFVFKNRPTKIEHLSKQKDTCGDFADGHDDEEHATQIEHLENIQSDSLENEEGSYTVEMNNGSYIGSESESRTSSEPYPEMTSSVEGKSINATSTEVELIGHKCQNIDDEAEDPFVVEQSKGDDSSASSYVKNGQFLEIVGSEEKDELSSVGESIPGMYGSDSDEEEVEEITTSDEQNSEDESDDRSRSSCSEESSDASPEPKKPKSIFEKPNPKIEQFFDRLQHFFEVRRKSDERAKSIDPSMKLRNLKVKIHSGGIERKNGKYKKEFQQRNMKNEVVENMDELYSVATTAESEFKLFLLQMVQDIKGVEEGSLILPSMKPRDRAFLKAKEDYLDRDPGPPESWLFDILRAGIVCKSYKQMADVNKWLGKNCSIVQAKNRFAEPAFNGYRDLLYHISLPFQEDLSHVCELQVHHREVYALNDQFGLPKHYEFFRPYFAGSSRVQDKTLENLAMMNSYGDVGGPLMKTLLKSRDHDQLILFADLFHEVLDEFDRALELYRRVLNLQENASGTEHPNLGSTYFRMGLVLGAMGDIHQSLYHLQKAKAIQESGADSVVIAETYSELGNMLHKKGDYAKALEHYQKALSIQKAKLGKRHFLAIKSLHHIGLSLKEMGLFEKAEKAYSDALQLQKDVLGETHPDVAKTHSLIGAVLCEVGHFQEAMEEYRHALSICEASLGKNHPLTADAHTHIGSLLQLKGEYEFAEWRYRKALRIQEAMLGKDHQNCASSHGHLGEVLSYQGKFEEAVMELKRAQEIQEATIGRDNPITSCSYIDLGNVYYSMGKYTEALKEYRRAKVIRESILGPHHPDTAAACICIGNVLVQQGNIENAVMEQKGAVAIFESVLGKSHPKTALAYESMARALEVDGSKEDALIQHRKALSIRANVLAKEHPDTASSCLQIGELLYKNGDGVGALVAFQQALAITIQVFGEEHINSATAHIKVGQVLMEQGKIHEAKQEIQQGLHVRLAKLPADHVDIGQTYMLMGSLYSMSSEFEKAAECHRKSKQILTNKLGKNHPEAQSARRKLDLAEKKQKE